MQQDRPADRRAGDGGVDHLEGHSHGEGQIGEVEVAGRPAAGKLDARGLLGALAVVEVRIPQCESSVGQGPGDRDGDQAESDQLAARLGGDTFRAAHQHGGGEKGDGGGEQRERVDRGTTGIFLSGAAPRDRRVAARDGGPAERQQQEGAGVPAAHRRQGSVVAQGKQGADGEAERESEQDAARGVPRAQQSDEGQAGLPRVKVFLQCWVPVEPGGPDRKLADLDIMAS